MLDLRGQAARFAEAGLAVPTFPLGLKGAAISFGRLDSDFPYLLDMPQSQIEALLAARATGLGAEIRWSAEVTGIEQDAGEVRVRWRTARSSGPRTWPAATGSGASPGGPRACRSPARPNPGSVLLADLFLDGLPMTDAYGDLSDRGMLLVFPFRDGSCRVVLYDYARAEVPVTEPVTLDEVRASLVAITGQDFAPRDMRWSGRYRSESRQAPAYRSGRIFLAGDAAHTHSPAGAQGMNTGLQDAVNLGWKLAAAASGRAPGWLLDSYQAERHPVGAAVLALAGRQFRLNTARTAPRRALRWAVHRIVAPLPPVQARLARAYSGLAIRYPADPAGSPPGRRGRAPPAGRRPAAARPGDRDGRQPRPGSTTCSMTVCSYSSRRPRRRGTARRRRDGAGPDGAAQDAGPERGAGMRRRTACRTRSGRSGTPAAPGPGCPPPL